MADSQTPAAAGAAVPEEQQQQQQQQQHLQLLLPPPPTVPSHSHHHSQEQQQQQQQQFSHDLFPPQQQQQQQQQIPQVVQDHSAQSLASSSPALSQATVPSNAPPQHQEQGRATVPIGQQPQQPPPPETPANGQEMLDRLKLFLATAPTNWDPEQTIKRFTLPNGEHISCVLWNNLFHITGTDIVRSLMFRFQCFGRPVKNVKKFEEGVFSDLRNLKPGIDATLEEPRSEFLEMLYKNNCIRTQKKQKVFYWFSVPHDRLFMDALERDLKREALGIEPTTVATTPMALLPTLELAKQQCMPTLNIKPEIIVNNNHPPAPAPEASSNVALDEWINDSPIGAAPGPVPESSNNFMYSGGPVQSASASFMSHEVPAPLASTNQPTLQSHPADRQQQQQQQGEYVAQAAPAAAATAPGQPLPMFSLFEGSPNYKQRRRAQSLFTLSKAQSYQPAPPVIAPEPIQPSPLRPHQPEERRNYVCAVEGCRRKFKRYEHLRRHMRCHTNERPYVCPVDKCGKSFSRSDNLSQHMKVHAGGGMGMSSSPGKSHSPEMEFTPVLHAHSLPVSPMLHSMGSPMLQHSHPNLQHHHQRAHSLPASPMLHSHTLQQQQQQHAQQMPIQLPHPQQYGMNATAMHPGVAAAYLPQQYMMHPGMADMQGATMFAQPNGMAAMQGHQQMMYAVPSQGTYQVGSTGSPTGQGLSGFAF